MILGTDGERLSKRHGATSVIEYKTMGFLPEALGNYLARLGWSHGDDEIFTREQLVSWFDLGHVSRSPARFDPEKLAWTNQQHLKVASDERLAALTGVDSKIVALLKDRAQSVTQITEDAKIFTEYAQKPVQFDRKAFELLKERLAAVDWKKDAISGAIKDVVKASGLKMPAIAMPLRVMVTGREQTPSIDAVLELLGREKVLSRLSAHLK